MAKGIVDPVQVEHADHGTVTVPAHKVAILETAGWSLVTKKAAKKKEDIDGES